MIKSFLETDTGYRNSCQVTSLKIDRNLVRGYNPKKQRILNANSEDDKQMCEKRNPIRCASAFTAAVLSLMLTAQAAEVAVEMITLAEREAQKEGVKS